MNQNRILGSTLRFVLASVLLVLLITLQYIPATPEVFRLASAATSIVSILMALYSILPETWKPTPRIRIIVHGVILIITLTVIYVLNFTTQIIPRVSSNEDWITSRDNYEWTRIIEGIEMVLVPPGCFMMGSNTERDEIGNTDPICFEKPFYIGRFETTVEQYDGEIGNLYPRTLVTWEDAWEFCKRKNLRLPKEHEWEYAARGPSGWRYPWKGLEDDRRVNSILTPVGSKPTGASWIGAMDMSGNVWEWVNSIHKDYPYDPTDNRENSSYTRGLNRVIRGGSYQDDWSDLRGSNRSYADQRSKVNFRGFRCARDYDG